MEDRFKRWKPRAKPRLAADDSNDDSNDDDDDNNNSSSNNVGERRGEGHSRSDAADSREKAEKPLEHAVTSAQLRQGTHHRQHGHDHAASKVTPLPTILDVSSDGYDGNTSAKKAAPSTASDATEPAQTAVGNVSHLRTPTGSPGRAASNHDTTQHSLHSHQHHQQHQQHWSTVSSATATTPARKATSTSGQTSSHLSTQQGAYVPGHSRSASSVMGHSRTASGVHSGSVFLPTTPVTPAPATRGHTRDYSIIMSEVVNGDGSIVPTLRAVFDSRSVDVESFLSALTDEITGLDHNIEKLCSTHSQGFVDAIEEVLALKEHTKTLQGRVEHVSNEVSIAGTSLQSSQGALVRERRRQSNILKTIKALNECVPVLRIYTKIMGQLENGQDYSAIKALEELEYAHLPAVLKYSFGRHVQAQTVAVREHIQRKAFYAMHSFLAEARKKVPEIGRNAMSEAAKEVTKYASKYMRMDSLSSLTEATRKISGVQRDGPVDNDDSDDDGEGESGDGLTTTTSATLNISFAPIYSCWHICSVLGVNAECAAYYKAERRKQAQLVIHPPGSLTSVTSFREYFAQLAGFFLVEETVLSTTEGLVSKQYVDEMWHLALTTVSTVVESEMMRCTTASMFRDVKDIIVTFRHVLMAYDYSVGRIVDILLQLRDIYQDVLFTTASESLRGILFADNYTQITLSTQAEYEELVERYPFSDISAEEVAFPLVLPFSEAVPNIYSEMKQFAFMSFIFIRDIGLSNTEVDELVRQSTNHLLAKVLSGTMSAIVHERKGLTLAQLTQISVNTASLEDACQLLEHNISSLTRTRGDSVHVTHLYAASDFKDARTEAEAQILQVLVTRIDQFIENADYDWAPSKPRTESSEFVSDMLTYLTTTFQTHTNLPTEVAVYAYFHTCKHICRELLQLVQSPEIKKVNLNGIRSFELDVRLCEEYAAGSQSIKADATLLKDIFKSLRELVDVFLNNDLEAYADEEVRKVRYQHLPPRIVILWLEKFDDSGERRFFRSSKDRKMAKFVENVTKRLKAQIAGISLSESVEGDMLVGGSMSKLRQMGSESMKRLSSTLSPSSSSMSLSTAASTATTKKDANAVKVGTSPIAVPPVVAATSATLMEKATPNSAQKDIRVNRSKKAAQNGNVSAIVDANKSVQPSQKRRQQGEKEDEEQEEEAAPKAPLPKKVHDVHDSVVGKTLQASVATAAPVDHTSLTRPSDPGSKEQQPRESRFRSDPKKAQGRTKGSALNAAASQGEENNTKPSPQAEKKLTHPAREVKPSEEQVVSSRRHPAVAAPSTPTRVEAQPQQSSDVAEKPGAPAPGEKEGESKAVSARKASARRRRVQPQPGRRRSLPTPGVPRSPQNTRKAVATTATAPHGGRVSRLSSSASSRRLPAKTATASTGPPGSSRPDATSGRQVTPPSSPKQRTMRRHLSRADQEQMLHQQLRLQQEQIHNMHLHAIYGQSSARGNRQLSLSSVEEKSSNDNDNVNSSNSGDEDEDDEPEEL